MHIIQYIRLVDEENSECSEALSYYNDLIEDLKSNVKKRSAKYSRALMQNEDFHQCLANPNGNFIFRTLSFVTENHSQFSLLNFTALFSG